MVQALRLNTMSKLTFADSSRFDALVRDVFSGVNFTNVEDQILMHALEEVYKEARLELIPSQVRAYEYIYLLANIEQCYCRDYNIWYLASVWDHPILQLKKSLSSTQTQLDSWFERC